MRANRTFHSEASWVSREPTYRVEFWERPNPRQAWNLDAWALAECSDVAEAFEWATEQSHGRPFELFVEIGHELLTEEIRQSSLIRLYGVNPNSE